MTTTFDRRVTRLSRATSTLEGAGFQVSRAIPSSEVEAVGPFIFLDHFGPIRVGPGEAKGAPDHPHAGIETISLLLAGRSLHKDSLGNRSLMQAGEVQWMRAGRGVLHDEGPDEVLLRDGGEVHGVQLWLNMPAARKQDPPDYRHFRAEEFPRIEGRNGCVRLIAGESRDKRGPLETHGDPFLAQVTIAPGGEIELETPVDSELAVHVLTGALLLADVSLSAGELACMTPGDGVRMHSAGGCEALVLGGDAITAPIVRYGPFVTNTVTDMHRVIADYQSGRMGHIPREFR